MVKTGAYPARTTSQCERRQGHIMNHASGRGQIHLVTPQECGDRQIRNGQNETTWLFDHVAWLLRSSRGPRQSDELVPMLNDVSVHLDVAAAVYRLTLSKSGSETVSLSDCLARLCAAAIKPLRLRERTNFEFYCEPGCAIWGEQALPLAAIVLEAMVNALRHAHPTGIPGTLSVSCRRSGDLVAIEVSDDGVGLPTEFDLDRDAGTGLHNVLELAHEIGGAIDLQSRPLGMTFRLTMAPATDLRLAAATA
jgi:two-component sensor histidine kinase